MLRNLALLAVLAVTSIDVRAHVLRGVTDYELLAYGVEEEDNCNHYYLKVCCNGICEEKETTYKSRDEVGNAQVCKTQCFDPRLGTR